MLVAALRADWLVAGVDVSAERFMLWRASCSFPAIWLKDHCPIGISDVEMFKQVSDQTGSSKELNEYSRRNARNELVRPDLAAMRVAFLVQ